MASPIDRAMSFNQTALDLRAYRQELLASNIANADTPNYQARDINFRAALAGALGTADGGQLALTQSEPGHLPAAGSNRYGAAVQYRTEYQPSADGNTVNMDVERAAFAKNAVQMEALLAFVRSQFKDLSAAVSP